MENRKTKGKKSKHRKSKENLIYKGKIKHQSRKRDVRKNKKEGKNVIGILNVNSKGTGYLETPEYDKDLEIQNNLLKTALNKDEVEVKILNKKDPRTGRLQAEVVRVLNRAKREFVGTIEKLGNQTCVIADDKKMYKYIALSGEDAFNSKSGEKVLVKIIKWDDKKDFGPEGVILKKIGIKGEHNTEMESILLEKGFSTEFPEEVEIEAQTVLEKEKNKKEENLKDRRDFRGTTTFTIDPVDAKDFDDAISIKKLENENYEIGIHIADVSHYVVEGTALDIEARNRAFSVYLVDRTIPMLPEILSNDLCSLNPNEDKLSYSAVFEITLEGKVLSRWFGKTIMRSNKRFSYESAQEILDTQNGEFFNELNTLDNIAKKLQKEKFDAGAIDFENEEVRFKLDATGRPISVFKKRRLDTHKLVEEFMLLANREVAHFIAKAHDKKNPKGTFIYRIHSEPDAEKMYDLSVFIKALGYNFETKGKRITSKDIAKMLEQIEGTPQESLIKTATIRSMTKAVYSTQNIGHFGLAFDYYTHFTSPIRRYPDLLVHRLLENHLKDGKIEADAFAKYEKIAMHSTEKEIAAAEAERGSIKYKQVEYMKERIGETFEGTISGVTEWGLYVEEIETKCEGMIRLRDLKNDYYSLDAKNYRIIGEKTKKTYSLGDKITFKVTGADLDRKTLDYIPV